uniref:Putative secreted protein n=1 Tax=Ixodes ricinus TaxID=34613 RepID=A0A6B0U644_IXORI
MLLYLRYLAAFESSFHVWASCCCLANDAVPSQSLERKTAPLAKGYFGELERKGGTGALRFESRLRPTVCCVWDLPRNKLLAFIFFFLV